MTKLTAALVVIVALLAPVSTAWGVYDATVTWLEYPAWVAASAAVALELVGMAAVMVVLTLRRWNNTKRKTDPAAPMLLAYVIIGGYVAVAELLTVALDPLLTRWTAARGVFPLLSLVGFALAGMMDDHAARVAQVAASKADEKAARAQHKADGILAKQQVSKVAKKLPEEKPDWRKLPAEDRQLIREMTPKQVAQQYAVKERTARGWVVAARKNGHVKEVEK